MDSDILFQDRALDLKAESRIGLDSRSVSVKSRTIDFKTTDSSNRTAVRISTLAGQVQLRGTGTTNHECGLVLLDSRDAKNVRITNQGVDADELERTRVFVDGANGNVTLGGDGTDGDLVLRDEKGKPTVHISAAVTRDRNLPQVTHPSASLKMNALLGLYSFGGVRGGTLQIEDRSGKPSVQVMGASGKISAQDITLTGADSVRSLKGELKELRETIAILQARLDQLDRP